MANSDLKHQIIQVVGAIPRGKVCTYGQVAKLAGLPQHARYVGTVLKQLPPHSKIPWHRVINSQGRLSFPAYSDKWHLQKSRLQQEGIEFTADRISLKRFAMG